MRRLQVAIGDVFVSGPFAVVVEAVAGSLAYVRRCDTGRGSRVQVRRLQEEYDRAGMISARQALKRLVAVVAEKAGKR
jgi:hypothetical protein